MSVSSVVFLSQWCRPGSACQMAACIRRLYESDGADLVCEEHQEMWIARR